MNRLSLNRRTAAIGCLVEGNSIRSTERMTNAFSKKVENLQAAVGLHFAHYNFVRIHSKHRVTPAMAAGVSDRLWSLHDLVDQTSK